MISSFIDIIQPPLKGWPHGRNIRRLRRRHEQDRDRDKYTSEIAITLEGIVEQDLSYYEALFAKLEENLR